MNEMIKLIWKQQKEGNYQWILIKENEFELKALKNITNTNTNIDNLNIYRYEWEEELNEWGVDIKKWVIHWMD